MPIIYKFGNKKIDANVMGEAFAYVLMNQPEIEHHQPINGAEYYERVWKVRGSVRFEGYEYQVLHDEHSYKKRMAIDKKLFEQFKISRVDGIFCLMRTDLERGVRTHSSTRLDFWPNKQTLQLLRNIGSSLKSSLLTLDKVIIGYQPAPSRVFVFEEV